MDSTGNLIDEGLIAHPTQVLTGSCYDGYNKVYIETDVINLVEENATTDNSILYNKYRMMWAGVEWQTADDLTGCNTSVDESNAGLNQAIRVMLFNNMESTSGNVNDFVLENLVIKYAPSRNTVTRVRIFGIFGWHDE